MQAQAIISLDRHIWSTVTTSMGLEIDTIARGLHYTGTIHEDSLVIRQPAPSLVDQDCGHVLGLL